jgi:hypothetical protein
MPLPAFLRRSILLFSRGLALFAGASAPLSSICGPFTDTANDSFCPFVLEVFYLGITTGTTSAT